MTGAASSADPPEPPQLLYFLRGRSRVGRSRSLSLIQYFQQSPAKAHLKYSTGAEIAFRAALELRQQFGSAHIYQAYKVFSSIVEPYQIKARYLHRPFLSAAG